MVQINDELLREMAQHRGLKLIKSRRRKPGTGDFGKFGLSDAAGNPLLGIADEGLTASAEDIQRYLRTNELGTWKLSADATPDAPPSSKTPNSKARIEETHEPRRAKIRVSANRSASPAPPKATASRAKVKREIRSPAQMRVVREAEPELNAKSESKPGPALRMRAATSVDSDALSALLNQLGGVSVDPDDVADNLAKARKAKSGILVAALDEKIVGCCGWAVIPTIHRGALGRLTVLVVDKRFRQRGIATQMLDAAQKALEAYGCHQLEVMSDIAINNSHNFFRSLDFEQKSYRFIRNISG